MYPLSAGAVSANVLDDTFLRAHTCSRPPLWGEESISRQVGHACRTSGDISPDVLSFNTVLRMLSGAGNARASLALLQCMASCGVYPRVSTYAIALASAAIAVNAPVVVEVWRSMSSLHVVPNIDCVNILLGTLVQQVREPKRRADLRRADLERRFLHQPAGSHTWHLFPAHRDAARGHYAAHPLRSVCRAAARTALRCSKHSRLLL